MLIIIVVYVWNGPLSQVWGKVHFLSMHRFKYFSEHVVKQKLVASRFSFLEHLSLLLVMSVFCVVCWWTWPVPGEGIASNLKTPVQWLALYAHFKGSYHKKCTCCTLYMYLVCSHWNVLFPSWSLLHEVIYGQDNCFTCSIQTFYRSIHAL